MPFFKGQKFTKKHRANIKKASLGRKAWNKGLIGIFKHTEKTRQRMSEAHKGLNTWSKGRKLSLATRKKMSESQKIAQRGEGNNNWKGDSVGYFALHSWVRKNWKVPRKCEFCGTEESYSYQWANLDGFYTRVRETWALLCGSCHRKHDYKRGKRTKHLVFK